MTISFTPEQALRYARQLALPEIGRPGQRRLLKSRVLVVGAGGLGSAAGFYLVAAGVGTVGLMDDDRVDLTNLQRQIAHRTVDVGALKVRSARRMFRALNPEVSIRIHPVRLDAGSAGDWLSDYDWVIDATDTFESKVRVARVCHVAGRPYVHGGIRRYYGQVLTVLPGRTACYRCLFPDEPPPAARRIRSQGPLGALAGLVGTIQAMEAIKGVLGIGILLTNRVLTCEVLSMAFRTVAIRRNAHCPLCA